MAGEMRKIERMAWMTGDTAGSNGHPGSFGVIPVPCVELVAAKFTPANG
jgi:hypothetical protein